MSTQNAKKNVKYDFTQPNMGTQEVAILPAGLAKRLLKKFAEDLTPATADEIIGDLVAKLNHIEGENRVLQATQISLDFVLERELIDNVTMGNWDAYAVIE